MNQQQPPRHRFSRHRRPAQQTSAPQNKEPNVEKEISADSPAATEAEKPKKLAQTSSRGKVRIIPLGGLHGIGRNITIIESDDELVIVDVGQMFTNDTLLGAERMIPDFTYLRHNKDKIKALVLTHGHEDHIGAIRYLFDDFNMPVYGTDFTNVLAKNKLSPQQKKRVQFHDVVGRQTIKVGQMKLEFFDVNHSIPGSLGVACHTRNGTVIHSGDFKIDHHPIVGKPTDLDHIQEIGQKGVLALISDSTNAGKAGFNIEEKEIRTSFDNIFKDAKGRIFVVCFASNIHRIQSVIDAANVVKRKICFSGRSMEEYTQRAIDLKILKLPHQMQVPIDSAVKMRPDKIVFVTTGSQGEPMSTLAKISRHQEKSLHGNAQDTFVLSSSVIPGNEKPVNKVLNNLYKISRHIFYDGNTTIHVSGHARTGEQEVLINLVKPKVFIPFHGETKHLMAHSDLAVKLGIKEENSFILNNGDILEIEKGHGKVIDKVPGEAILVVGYGRTTADNPIFQERFQLGSFGVAVLTVTVNVRSKKLVANPTTNSRGLILGPQEQNQLQDAPREVERIFENYIKTDPEFNVRRFKNHLDRKMAEYYHRKLGRKPMILPVVITVE